MTKKATKNDVAAIEFIPADLDPRPNETPERAKARYLAALEHEPTASVIINSGNGIQGLWRLSKRVEVPENAPENDARIADIEARTKALMERMGAKAGTQNIDRILRIPGTVNLPNAAKRRVGRVRCEARLLRANGAAHPLDAFPLAVDKGAKIDKAVVELPHIDFSNLPDVDVAALPIPDATKAVIDSDGGPVGERSDTVFHVVCVLMRAGCSDQEIASVLWHQPIGAHCHDQKDPERAVCRAIGKAHERNDATNEFNTVKITSDSVERQDQLVFNPWDAYVVPPFPLDIFPDAIRQFIDTQARVIGCDQTAVAMTAIATLSAALNHRFALKMLRNGDWYASPRLWVLLVGDPSRKKTPAINASVGALECHEQTLWDFWERDRPEAKTLLGDDYDLPKPMRFVIGDVTVEKLADILSRQDRGTLGPVFS